MEQRLITYPASSSVFREQGMGDSTDEDSATESSSDSGFGDDDESKLESMTGKGVKRLCSELLELKRASDEDFHKSVYSNHSAFVRIFEEVGGLENELMELKRHVSTQRKLVKDLMNGIYPEVLLEGSTETVIEEAVDPEQSLLGKLEVHRNTIAENLDILLSEQRLEEALATIEMVSETLQRIELEEDHPSQIAMLYNAAVSVRRTQLADQFAFVAEHPRVAGPEFQKALSGLCRLGDNQRANFLLLKFYHLRLSNTIHDLQCSKPFLHGTYINELCKMVFSVISQAATSFLKLYGETSPYASELIQWVREETKTFVLYFDKYVKSISEISGGLSLAVEAVQLSLSYCSLLESQRIVLLPFLIKLIRPCMEGILEMHIAHFKKVITIFTTTDSWILGKFPASGILRDKPSPLGTDDKVEYFLLTKSGKKFAALLQTIMEDISPLIAIQMKNSILTGVADLFNEYIDILQRAIPRRGNHAENDGPRGNSAQTLSQQLSILANSSVLSIHFFSRIAGCIFKDINHSDGELLTAHIEYSQHKELDRWKVSIQESADRLRDYFCQQFVYRVMSLGEGESNLSAESYVNGCSESGSLQDLMPSVSFQALYLQLWQLEKLAIHAFVGVDWMVKKLLRELMQFIFVWLSSNQEFWTIVEESSIIQQCSGFEQFIIDMQFLVEIARFGDYFSDSLEDASLALISRMELAFLASGLDPDSSILDDGRTIIAAKAAIEKLQYVDKKELLRVGGTMRDLEEDFNEQQGTIRDASESVEDEDRSSSADSVDLEDGRTDHGGKTAVSKIQGTEKIELTSREGLIGLLEEDNSYDDGSSRSSDVPVDFKDEPISVVNTQIDESQETEKETEVPIIKSPEGVTEVSSGKGDFISFVFLGLHDLTDLDVKSAASATNTEINELQETEKETEDPAVEWTERVEGVLEVDVDKQKRDAKFPAKEGPPSCVFDDLDGPFHAEGMGEQEASNKEQEGDTKLGSIAEVATSRTENSEDLEDELRKLQRIELEAVEESEFIQEDGSDKWERDINVFLENEAVDGNISKDLVQQADGCECPEDINATEFGLEEDQEHIKHK